MAQAKVDSKSARKVATVAGGRRVSLADMPLVAYRLNCGHLGRDYAVQKRDLIFCADCGANKRVTAIIS